MTKTVKLALIALVIGVVNAVMFKLFELVATNGTNWLWNDLFHSDTNRWLVIPLAVGLGILFSAVIRGFGEKRWVKPKTDLMAEEGEQPHTLEAMGVILAIGAASLLAGASLGPEMPLTGASMALGAWVTYRLKKKELGQLLILVSFGALMVSFFGSLLVGLLPLLVVYKKTKKLPGMAVLMVTIASLAAYGVIQLIDHANPGYGTIPAVPAEHFQDYVAAAVVGLLAAGVAFLLKGGIQRFAGLTKRLDGKVHWLVSAGVFGLVLGIIYLLGGSTVEFSGSIGTHLLVQNAPTYGLWTLLGLVVAKLFATVWSMASGYRGGMVFPSVYMGVALGLFLGTAISALAGSGAMIGGVAGVFGAITGSPVVAFLFIASLLPLKLLGVAVAAILGAAVGERLVGNFLPKPQPAK